MADCGEVSGAATGIILLRGNVVLPRALMTGKYGPAPAGSVALDRAKARGMLVGNVWERRVEIFVVGGMVLVDLWVCGEGASDTVGTRDMEDCWLVGEALRLEFLLLRAEKSMRSSLLDSSRSLSFPPMREDESPSTPELRMCRLSCLRLCEVIWLVEVNVKPHPVRIQ